jgi:hypothetical protein
MGGTRVDAQKAQHGIPACKWVAMPYYLYIFNNILNRWDPIME